MVSTAVKVSATEGASKVTTSWRLPPSSTRSVDGSSTEKTPAASSRMLNADSVAGPSPECRIIRVAVTLSPP